ncbi:MAG: GTPase ObgE [Candidatus Staskawiczbacteria bacterium]|nr:GTPase ObgE [Candidatus Staskawiczbacteria bacterium]
MIVDEVKINVEGGHGGKGLATFSKVKWALGPTGGNGGIGGDVFIEGVADLSALKKFRFKKDYKADKGENGKSGLHDGRKADCLTLFVPVGTVCHILNRAEEIEITKIGQRELIAKGGKGGRGNFLFRSATNTSPMQFQEGKPGEYFDLKLELKLIADVGFIGLPNVGKSSLLNELTNAKSKVANYAFTTLEPNLGAYYDLILADIPGLIEGASLGKGLGTKFLRHIERTKVLFHLISAESPTPIKDYNDVRSELLSYKKSLTEKPEYIFLTKSDSVDKKVISGIKKDFKKIKKEIISISIIDPESINTIKKILNGIIAEKVV